MPVLETYKGYYYIKFYDADKGYTTRRTTGLKATAGNKTPATRRLREFNKTYTGGTHQLLDKKQLRISLDDALDEYLDIKLLRPKTCEVYRLAVNHFKSVLQSSLVASISKTDYRRLLKRFDDRMLSQNSRSMYLRHLRALWKYFVKCGYAQENIITKIKYVDKAPEPIAPADLTKILNYLYSKSKKQYYIIKFLTLTGSRISTALVLDWKDINWKVNEIRLRNIKINQQPFLFPLTRELKKLFQEMGTKLGGNVFGYKSRFGLIFWRRMYDDKEFKVKRKYTLHQLRKTFYSEMVNSGISLDDLGKVTNTDTRTLKKHYAKLDLQRIQKQLEAAQ